MKKNEIKIDADNLQTIVAVAHAYYEQNATQQEIATELGISRSQISRYLDKARETGIVKIVITQPDARNEKIESMLKSKYKHLKDVIIVPFSSSDVSESLLGRACANYIMGILQDGNFLGIGTGRGVRDTVKWFTPSRKRISIVQAMGSTGYYAQGVDYTLLANEAASNLKAPLYIINAPTILWRNTGTVENLLKANPKLTKNVNLSRNCNVYLIGIGAIENDDYYVKGGLLDQKEIDEVHKSGAIGNICGSYFYPNGKTCHTQFEDRIIGVRRSDIQKADYSVLIGTGIQKVNAINAALIGEFVNVLATDENTADLLLKL